MNILENLSLLENKFRESKHQNISVQVEILKLVRENNLLRPRLVIGCGTAFIDPEDNNHSSAVKAIKKIELFEIYHQVFRAALDLHNYDMAKYCFAVVRNQFGDSSFRVRMMEGLLFEGQGKFVKAKIIYQDIVDDDKAHIIAVKRLVAIQKARGELKEAIETLNGMIDHIFLADTEGYLELADLYIEVNDYSSAIYCLEKCLMHDSTNYFFYLRIGDVYYTLGEYFNARKFYAKSLELNKECMRANLGLILAIKSSKDSAKEKKKYHKILKEELNKNIVGYYGLKNPIPEINEAVKNLCLK